MEADVVEWLQHLRYTVAEESEPWNLFSLYHEPFSNSIVGTLVDIDSTSSVSDFEYINMNDQPSNRLSLIVNHDTQQDSVSLALPTDEISVSSKTSLWSNIHVWKNGLTDIASSSPDNKQVFTNYL
jgi:hypothetical protein